MWKGLLETEGKKGRRRNAGDKKKGGRFSTTFYPQRIGARQRGLSQSEMNRRV